MARRSKVVANDRRRATVAQYAVRRRELQAVIRSPRTGPAERRAAEAELRAQPRDASPTRVRSRDVVDGRPRGVLTTFGLSRIRFREMAHAGELPGIRKASW